MHRANIHENDGEERRIAGDEERHPSSSPPLQESFNHDPQENGMDAELLPPGRQPQGAAESFRILPSPCSMPPLLPPPPPPPPPPGTPASPSFRKVSSRRRLTASTAAVAAAVLSLQVVAAGSASGSHLPHNPGPPTRQRGLFTIPTFLFRGGSTSASPPADISATLQGGPSSSEYGHRVADDAPITGATASATASATEVPDNTESRWTGDDDMQAGQTSQHEHMYDHHQNHQQHYHSDGTADVHAETHHEREGEYEYQHEHEYEYEQDQDQDQDHGQDEYQPPRIRLDHMALALRLTSEWNRKLVRGVSQHVRFWQSGLLSRSTPHSLLQNSGPAHGPAHSQAQQRQLDLQPQLEGPLHSSHYASLQQRGGDSQPVNVHPSRHWNPPIPVGVLSDVDPELTLFHAKTPRPQRQGVLRWGPDLHLYLEHVCKLIGVDSDCVEIPLAMIYLDRACSVETPRSNNVPPCPYCTPRTVHRLSLAALLLSVQAVQGGALEDYYVTYQLESLGVPMQQLQYMVDWLQGALGDRGLQVTYEEMKEFGRTWDAIFEPQQQMDLERLHQERLRLQQEQLRQHHRLARPYESIMAMGRLA